LCGAALCDAEGIAPKEFLAIFEGLAPVIAHSDALAVEQIAASEYPGDDCRMAVHAAAAPVMLRAARESGINVGLHAAIGSLIERTLELGHRDSSLASIFTAARSGGPVLGHD
jgi:hypothetical protein